MSPGINVTDDQFRRFQKFAIPLIDTPETAFEKLLALAENAAAPSTAAALVKQITPSSLADVRHTTVTRARVDGVDTARYWNSALVEVLSKVKAKMPLDEATRGLPINISSSKKLNHGYKWHSSLGVSVQGVAANEAVKTIASLAKRFGIDIKIEFEWQDKAEAAFPGQMGLLTVS